MSDETASVKKKKSPYWFYVLLLLAGLGTVFGLTGAFFSGDMTNTIEEQLGKLRENKVTQAYYDYTSKIFQETTPLDAFREFISLYPVLSDNKTFLLQDQNMENNNGHVSGTLVSKQMHEMKVEYQLVKEDYQWKILTIRLKEALRGDDLDALTKELAQKAQDQLNALRKENIIDAYYGFVSKDFQKETPIQVFKEFVASNPVLTNYTGLKIKDRRVENDLGIIELVLSANGSDYLLEYKMKKENDDWKIWSLRVVLPAEEAAKKTSTNPEALVPPARELLDALLLNKIENAYSETAKEFQDATSFEAFQAFVKSNPVFTRRDLADFKSGMIENGVGKLRVNLHDQDGMTVVEFKLGFEGNGWKIWSMEVMEKPNAKKDTSVSPRQMSVGNQTLAESILSLVQDQLETLKHQDYETAYYNYSSQSYRDDFSLEKFERYLSKNPPFTQTRSSEFSRLGKEKDKIVVFGTITTFGYKKIPVKYEIVKENRAWKIQSFGIRAEGDKEIAMADLPLNPPAPEKKDPRIEKIVIGNRVDSKGEIQTPRVVIDPDEKLIYINVVIQDGVSNAAVVLSLTHIDSDTTTLSQTAELRKDGNSVVSFSYAAPEKGWPEGNYVAKAKLSTGQEAIQKFQMRQDEKGRY